MGVSKNNGTPKSSILIGFSIINHPFWGTPFLETSIFIYIYIQLPFKAGSDSVFIAYKVSFAGAGVRFKKNIKLWEVYLFCIAHATQISWTTKKVIYCFSQTCMFTIISPSTIFHEDIHPSGNLDTGSHQLPLLSKAQGGRPCMEGTQKDHPPNWSSLRGKLNQDS